MAYDVGMQASLARNSRVPPDFTPELHRLVEAFENPGPVPSYHYEVMKETQKRWPTLMRVVADIVVKKVRIDNAR